MWSPSWERPGRRSPEPREVARETRLHPPSNLKTLALQSVRAAPEDSSSSWNWRARPAGKNYTVLGSCSYCQGFSKFHTPEQTLIH